MGKKHHSKKHLEARADLVHDLKLYIASRGTMASAAKRVGMDAHNFRGIFRQHRKVSLSNLQEIGNKLGLELVMKWETKRG